MWTKFLLHQREWRDACLTAIATSGPTGRENIRPSHAGAWPMTWRRRSSLSPPFMSMCVRSEPSGRAARAENYRDRVEGGGNLAESGR